MFTVTSLARCGVASRSCGVARKAVLLIRDSWCSEPLETMHVTVIAGYKQSTELSRCGRGDVAFLRASLDANVSRGVRAISAALSPLG